MDTNNTAGRVSKHTFTVTTLVLLVVCLISVCVHFYIKLGIQKEFNIDDGLLIFGLCCVITAQGLFFTYAEGMYLSEALVLHLSTAVIPANWKDILWSYEDKSTAALVLSWCTISSVKFSFLALFKKLVDRLRNIYTYWWIAAIYNVLVCIYGITVFITACPYYHDSRSLTCGTASHIQKVIALSLSSLVLDIVGDFLILVIPVYIIWQIRIEWKQKLGLALSLCLTIVLIVITIIRSTGLKHTTPTLGTYVDPVWEIFFQMISSYVGLILVAATAFRTFFVAHFKAKANEKVGQFKAKRSIVQGAKRCLSGFIPLYRIEKASTHNEEENLGEKPENLLPDMGRGIMEVSGGNIEDEMPLEAESPDAEVKRIWKELSAS